MGDGESISGLKLFQKWTESLVLRDAYFVDYIFTMIILRKPLNLLSLILPKTVWGSILQDWIVPIWTTGIPMMVLEFCKNRRKVRFWKTSISLKRVVVVLRIFLSLFYFFMRTTNAKKVWREKVGKFNQIFGKLQKYFIRTTYGQKWPDTGCNWRKHSKMSHLLLK